MREFILNSLCFCVCILLGLYLLPLILKFYHKNMNIMTYVLHSSIYFGGVDCFNGSNSSLYVFLHTHPIAMCLFQSFPKEVKFVLLAFESGLVSCLSLVNRMKEKQWCASFKPSH